MMNGYRDITEEYGNLARIDFAQVKPKSTFSIDKLYRGPEGRVFEPAGNRYNLFAVVVTTGNPYDFDLYPDPDDFIAKVVAEFATYQEAEQLLKHAEEMGHHLVTDDDRARKFSKWHNWHQDVEFITEKYIAIPRTDLSTLDKRIATLFRAELIKTGYEGHIVIPEMGQGGANLFPVFAATDKLELVAEFWDRTEAEKYLDNAQAEGWRVMQGGHIFPGSSWFASVAPEAARVSFPWIEKEFPHWLATKLKAAA